MAVPIGLQLYSVRDDMKKDLPGTLKAVAAMGYKGVEFAGYFDRTAADLRKMLDDLGLVCCGTHIRLDTLLGGELAKTIEFNKTLGNTFLIVPSLPQDKRSSKAGWTEAAKVFNDLADKVRPHGMRVGYHNHDFEFKPLEGAVPWDLFFGATTREVVMQLDTGNCRHGGGDPVKYLTAYPGRATTVHLKGYRAGSETKWAVIGDDDTDWKSIFRLCETTGGTQWYIVEQEDYRVPPLECVKRALQNLRKMGK